MKFQVKVKRTVEHTAEFEVEAINEDDAETVAMKRIELNSPRVNWDEYDSEYDFEEIDELDDDSDDEDEE